MLEAGLIVEEQAWCLLAAGKFRWSKTELRQAIDSAIHPVLWVDADQALCDAERSSKHVETQKAGGQSVASNLSYGIMQKATSKLSRLLDKNLSVSVICFPTAKIFETPPMTAIYTIPAWLLPHDNINVLPLSIGAEYWLQFSERICYNT